jgi:transposase
VIVSEYVQDKTIQRIVAGREGGNTLTITNMDGEVQFSIREHGNPGNTQIVSLSGKGFNNLLTRILTLDVEEVDFSSLPAQVREHTQHPPEAKKLSLPENLDDLDLSKSRKSLGSSAQNSEKQLVRWTKDEDERLVELIRSGKTDKEAAEIMGRSESSIGNRKMKIRPTHKIPKKYKKNGASKASLNAWSDEQTSELVRRAAMGEGNEHIAIAIGRSPISVRDKRRVPLIKDMIEEAKQETLQLTKPVLEEVNGQEN